MYITSLEVAQSLNISINYFFKLCYKAGLMKKESYSLAHLEFLLLSLKSSNSKSYKCKVLIKKLTFFIDEKKVDYVKF